MSFLRSLFGSSPQANFNPSGFNAGGINASFGPGGYNITTSPERTAAVEGLRSALGDQADILGGLRESVGPGFNDLLKSRLNDINNTATSAIGSLRQTLAARRILGSSFGSDTINRANIDFQQQRDKTIAENMLQSLDANQKLLAQEYAARTGAYQSALNEWNLEAGLGSTLTGQANDVMSRIAQLNAQIDAQSQAGAGKFVGTALAIGAAPFTGGASLAALGIPWNRAGGGGSTGGGGQ